ncbi:thiamine-phosphate kinase [Nocardia camponoti]|uniref:thiamine-phosphate kinase n=1 Tax=Nocardia camponoti TaxID=1616106 RepID=UPI001669628A
MSEDGTAQTVRELGEFALIDRINAGRAHAREVLIGPGDDAALIAAPDGRFVVTTDMLVEGRHFRFDWSSPVDVGRKAIAQNAADVVAMGARPTSFVVALGCPADTPVSVIEGLADGMWQEAARAGGSIAGGDLVRSSEVVISVTAFGDLGGAVEVRRSGASKGEIVAVAGELGWSAAGLALLERGTVRATTELSRFEAKALETHRVPQPVYDAVLALAANRPRALTDISDGLLADLGHLARASGVSIDIDRALLADPELDAVATSVNADAPQWILAGGEDHAFAGTFDADAPLPPGWRRIGTVGVGSGVTVDGTTPNMRGGWDSFRGSDESSTPSPR